MEMTEKKYEDLVSPEQIAEFIRDKNKDEAGRPSMRPPIEVLVYLSDVKGLQTSEIAKIVGVQPNTIRVWRHLARKGEYK